MYLSGGCRFHCFVVWALPFHCPCFGWNCQENSQCYLPQGWCGWTQGKHPIILTLHNSLIYGVFAPTLWGCVWMASPQQDQSHQNSWNQSILTLPEVISCNNECFCRLLQRNTKLSLCRLSCSLKMERKLIGLWVQERKRWWKKLPNTALSLLEFAEHEVKCFYGGS